MPAGSIAASPMPSILRPPIVQVLGAEEEGAQVLSVGLRPFIGALRLQPQLAQHKIVGPA